MQRSTQTPVPRNAGGEFHAPDSKILLTVEQTMAITSLGKTTVFRLLKTGEIQSITVGKARRIVRSSLDEWVARRLVDAS